MVLPPHHSFIYEVTPAAKEYMNEQARAHFEEDEYNCVHFDRKDAVTPLLLREFVDMVKSRIPKIYRQGKRVEAYYQGMVNSKSDLNDECYLAKTILLTWGGDA